MVKYGNTWRPRMTRYAILLLAALVPAVFACPPNSNNRSSVTTAAAAILTARQSWASLYEKLNGRNPVYSKKETAKFEPYTATLSNGIWLVRGTIPLGFHGETIETNVCQSDGSVSMVVVEIK